ncbi:MAG: CDP-alcohol phosphatidyltransferase family protein [Thermoleophilia bacterium]
MSTAPQRVKQAYAAEVRRIASRSVEGLAGTRLHPTALTVAGALVSMAAGVLVYLEYLHEILFFWLGAAVFVLGSALDILDGALARAGGKATPFGAFIDSTTDRIGEAFMLGAIGLVFMRHGQEVALAFSFAAVCGSFLVSYARSRAEALGLRGDVGLGGRAERVALITVGLVFAPWGALPWAIYALTALAWTTVAQRVWSVRQQLRSKTSR